MKCNWKTMVAVVLALVTVITLGYWAFPPLRGPLATLAVIASGFICPLSMIFMMRGTQFHADGSGVDARLTDRAEH
ncbi:DUF2933 domain-containing protein [Burkholderia ubonensis]|uniref:DUF2933 domain-containing protein n=1 Tax=Burkholderia ubonensis TaxID=101571 RepID=UPI00075CD97A|nr:DUF2933 domain-containing protein [Burkholderia ubonensis]KWB22461.1 hypothetical protein WL33_02210 [Burkholderia ubonensis]